MKDLIINIYHNVATIVSLEDYQQRKENLEKLKVFRCTKEKLEKLV